MRATVWKCGNNLAICIPKGLANEIELNVGSDVELRFEDGCLKIYPPGAPRHTIEELVAQITPENRHDEIDWGPPVGKEVW
jgi:antitoxin MazE